MQLQALIKYLASFAKPTWELEDYPVRLIYQGVSRDAALPKDLSLEPWRAEIVNWGTVVGLGKDERAALTDLQCNFDEYKRRYAKLPRPGTRAPLAFASADEISRYEDIAREYFRRVLLLDYDDCFVSDESRLADFWGGGDYLEKTKRFYGVDISDIEDGNLVRVLKRLQEKRTWG